MKKLILSMAALLLAASLIASGALAQGLERAIPQTDMSQFESYSGFECNPVTGDWTLRSEQADVIAKYAEGESLSSYKSKGILLMYMQIDGNARTGRFMPSLHILHVGDAKDASALSIRIDDMRYDLPVAPVKKIEAAEAVEESADKKSEDKSGAEEEGSDEEKDSGKKTEAAESPAQEYSVPLDEKGLALMQKLMQSDLATVRLHGEKSYTTKLIRSNNYDTKRERLEGMSLDCLDLFRELALLGNGAYLFRNQDIARWEEASGAIYQIDTVDLSASVEAISGAPKLDREMQMLSSGSKGSQVRLLNKLLVKMRLIAEYQTENYDAQTSAAIRSVQTRCGMVPTGSLDARLSRILFGAKSPDIPQYCDDAPETGTTVAINGGKTELVLNSYWLANRIETSQPSGVLSRIDCSDGNRVLLVLDGQLTNRSDAELFLSELPVDAVVNGVTFKMTVRAETDNGQRFSGSLLPLESARAVLYCELPANALADGAAVSVEFADGEKCELEISPLD